MKTKRIMNCLIGLSILALLNITGCGGSEEIDFIKNGKLSAYPQRTVGEAINGYMGDPKWELIIAEDGIKYVNATGKITYMDKPVKAMLQFKLNSHSTSFEINALEINELPQNLFMISGLINNMFTASKNSEDFKACRAMGHDSEANVVAAMLADYFADPSNTTMPTVNDLKNLGDYFKEDLYVEIIGSSPEDYQIIVSNLESSRSIYGKCPEGQKYIKSYPPQNSDGWQ